MVSCTKFFCLFLGLGQYKYTVIFLVIKFLWYYFYFTCINNNSINSIIVIFLFQSLAHCPWIQDHAEHQELNAGTLILSVKAASPLCIVDVMATTIILKIKNNAKRCVRRDLVSKIYLINIFANCISIHWTFVLVHSLHAAGLAAYILDQPMGDVIDANGDW